MGKAWFNDRIDEALRDVLLEDRNVVADGIVPEDFGHTPYAFLVRTFLIEDSMAASAAVRFNGLEEATRRAVIALVVERRTLAECVEDGLGSGSELLNRLRRGLRALFVHPCLNPEGQGGRS